MKFRKAAALLAMIAGITLVGACSSDDDSTSAAAPSSSAAAPVVKDTSIPEGATPGYPADFPEDFPRISGSAFKKLDTGDATGSYQLEIYGLDPAAFDAAVKELEGGGFTAAPATDNGTTHSVLLSRGTGQIASLVSDTSSGRYVVIYTVRKS